MICSSALQFVEKLFDFINSVLISDDVLKCSGSSEKIILFCQHACRHLESLLLFQLSFLRSYIIGKVYIGSPSQLVSNTNETSLHPNFFPQVFTQDSSQYSDQLSCKTENSTTTFNLINSNLLEWPRFSSFQHKRYCHKEHEIVLILITKMPLLNMNQKEQNNFKNLMKMPLMVKK